MKLDMFKHSTSLFLIVFLFGLCFCSPHNSQSESLSEELEKLPKENENLEISVTTNDSEDVFTYTAALSGDYIINTINETTIRGEYGFLCSTENIPTFENSIVFVTDDFCYFDEHFNYQTSFSRRVFLEPDTEYHYRSYLKLTLPINKVFYGDVKQLKTSVVTEEVDLGLKANWRAYNIGATSVTDSGYLLAYGESEPKQEYQWDNYKWKNDLETGIISIDFDWESAIKEIGEGWRMPTQRDFEELSKYCTFCAAERNGIVYGIIAMRNGSEVLFLFPAPQDIGAGVQQITYWTNSGIEKITEIDDTDPRNPLTKTYYKANALSLIILYEIGLGYSHIDVSPFTSYQEVYLGHRVRPVKDWKSKV